MIFKNREKLFYKYKALKAVYYFIFTKNEKSAWIYFLLFPKKLYAIKGKGVKPHSSRGIRFYITAFSLHLLLIPHQNAVVDYF